MLSIKIRGGKEETENILGLNENMNTFYLKLLTNTDNKNNYMWALLNEFEDSLK